MGDTFSQTRAEVLDAVAGDTTGHAVPGFVRTRLPTRSQRLVEVRRRHPMWGAKQLLKIVATRHPTWALPARGTVCDLLDRAGVVRAPRRRQVRRVRVAR